MNQRSGERKAFYFVNDRVRVQPAARAPHAPSRPPRAAHFNELSTLCAVKTGEVMARRTRESEFVGDARFVADDALFHFDKPY